MHYGMHSPMYHGWKLFFCKDFWEISMALDFEIIDLNTLTKMVNAL